MKYSKKILVMLMVFVLCTVFAACGSPAGNTGGDAAKAEPAAENSKNEEISEAEPETEAETVTEEESVTGEDEEKDTTSDQTDATVKKANVGIIAWFTGMGDEYEFVEAVQTNLAEQYLEQIGDVIVMDAQRDTEMLSVILDNMIAMWEGEKAVILIVNDKDGFSDEELLGVMNDAEKAGMITGVDHAIDGAPESTFVYDASDAAGCSAMIVENASK